MKQFFLLAAVAILALAGGFGTRYYANHRTDDVISALPDFALPDLAGQSHTIGEWQGKILVINFWATWCPPCLEEIPAFIKLQKQYGQQGVQFIGIAIDDDFAIEDFMKTTPLNYPNLMGQEQGISLAEQLGNRSGAIPFTVIVNQQGQIVHRQPGELSTEKLVSILQPLLKPN